jgi:hypothetical protein
MLSIHGGSLTWDLLSFAASIDGFGGFLFMLKRKGRSGGFFGGWTPLNSDPSSQDDFFLAISLRHLERKVRNSARFFVRDVVVCHVADHSCTIVVTVSF